MFQCSAPPTPPVSGSITALFLARQNNTNTKALLNRTTTVKMNLSSEANAEYRRGGAKAPPLSSLFLAQTGEAASYTRFYMRRRQATA